ncbi:uncharacterized protein METZ01_LOCUS257838, partial [marine metagenome]
MPLCFVLLPFSAFVHGQNPGKGDDAFSSLESRLQEMTARYQKVLSPHTSPGAAAGTGSVSPIVGETRSDDGGQAGSSVQFRLPGEGDQGDSLASQGVKKDSLEVSRGSYYLLPFVSLAMPSSVALDVSGGSGSQSDLEAEIGYALGFSVGRRWKNWVGEFHLDYGKTEYASISDPKISRVYPAAGESELIVVGARAGYGFRLGEDGWLRMGLGVGIGSRDDEVTNLLSPGNSPPPTDHSVFTYDALLGLGYAFTENFSGRVGYRF